MLLFANFQFDAESQTLTDMRTGDQQTLSFSESAVLKQLLQVSSVVSKAELQAAGWPNRNATDASLNQCISTLRRKLTSDNTVELKTIPRHGYLLVCPQSPRKFTVQFKLIAIVAVTALLLSITTLFWIQSSSNAIELPFSICDNNHITQVTDKNCETIALPSNIAHKSAWVGRYQDYYSTAVCVESNCQKEGWLNLIQTKKVITSEQLIKIPQQLEQQKKTPRNQLTLPSEPQHATTNEHTELHYNHHIYYPTDTGGIIRVDYRMTLLYTDSTTGIMTVDACISLLDCNGASIQYQAQHKFSEFKTELNGQQISAFKADNVQQELTPDQHLGNQDELFTFYQKLRSDLLLDKDVWFYRLDDANKYGIWQLPLLGHPVAWLHRQQLLLGLDNT